MGHDEHHCHHFLHLRLLLRGWLVQDVFFLKPFLPNISVHAAAVAMVEMEASLGRVSNESRDSAATQPRLMGATHQQPLQLHTDRGEEAMCNA